MNNFIYKNIEMKKYLIMLMCMMSSMLVHAQLMPNLGGQRAGTSAFNFLKLNFNPRATAMAGASAAMPGDAYAAAANPAALIDIKELSFALSSQQYYAGANTSYLAAVLPTKHYSAWAFQLQSYRTDAMEKRTEFQPYGTGEYFYGQNLALGVSYSKILSDYFSYGISAKYVYEGIDNYSAHTGVVDLGFLYKTDFKDLKFAVLLSNFGINTKIDGETNTLVAFNNSTEDINAYAAPTLFKMGVSLVPYKSGRNQLLVAAELQHPNDNSENIRLGLEYSWMDLFFVRAGYKLGLKDQSTPTFGAGIRTHFGRYPLNIIYAADPHPNLGFAQQIGVAITLTKEKR